MSQTLSNQLHGTLKTFYRCELLSLQSSDSITVTDATQCAFPCFEGLAHSPPNEVIMDLLFIMALWHGFAKMRLHTDTTVAILRGLTSELGRLLQQFKSKVCTSYQTEETPAEHSRRLRRLSRNMGQLGRENADSEADLIVHAAASSSRRSRTVKKEYNLSTYKLHALGHYADTIIRFGSTTSYSSQTVCFVPCMLRLYPQLTISDPYQGERAHRDPKQLYRRTNKRWNGD
jgi:hypothetical protein